MHTLPPRQRFIRGDVSEANFKQRRPHLPSHVKFITRFIVRDAIQHVPPIVVRTRLLQTRQIHPPIDLSSSAGSCRQSTSFEDVRVHFSTDRFQFVREPQRFSIIRHRHRSFLRYFIPVASRWTHDADNLSVGVRCIKVAGSEVRRVPNRRSAVSKSTDRRHRAVVSQRERKSFIRSPRDNVHISSNPR